jgi:hypothetical protein
MSAEASGNFVRLQTVAAGASETFTVAAGSVTDALTILGITPGTYDGSGNDDYILPSAYARIKSATPFVQDFDSRDEGLARAESKSLTWTATVVARLKAAIDELRAQTDTFTTESMETY